MWRGWRREERRDENRVMVRFFCVQKRKTGKDGWKKPDVC
jgi:hypothetical protein